MTLKVNLKQAGTNTPITDAAEVTLDLELPSGAALSYSLVGGTIAHLGGGTYGRKERLVESGDYEAVWRARSPAGEYIGVVHKFYINPLT